MATTASSPGPCDPERGRSHIEHSCPVHARGQCDRRAVRRNHQSPEEVGQRAAGGLEYHVAFRSNGEFRVSEIWDSWEQFDAFGERLMPVLKDVGIELVDKPEMLEIHNIIKR
jgi:hypothetical protein